MGILLLFLQGTTSALLFSQAVVHFQHLCREAARIIELFACVFVDFALPRQVTAYVRHLLKNKRVTGFGVQTCRS